MRILAIIQTHPNQPNVQAATTGFPNLEHRFTLLGDVLDVSSARSLIDDIEKTITAELKLIEQYVSTTQETRLDFQTVYYGLHSIRKELGDMSAIINHLRSVWKRDHQDLLPEKISIFDVINQMLVRAEIIISLLCDQFADDDIAIPNNTHVCGAITSVIHEISEISETVEDLHLIAKKRQV